MARLIADIPFKRPLIAKKLTRIFIPLRQGFLEGVFVCKEPPWLGNCRQFVYETVRKNGKKVKSFPILHINDALSFFLESRARVKRDQKHHRDYGKDVLPAMRQKEQFSPTSSCATQSFSSQRSIFEREHLGNSCKDSEFSSAVWGGFHYRGLSNTPCKPSLRGPLPVILDAISNMKSFVCIYCHVHLRHSGIFSSMASLTGTRLDMVTVSKYDLSDSA